MPLTVSHVLSATTPDDPAYEIQVKHWNSSHAYTLNISGSEISGAFSNSPSVSFGLSAGALTGSVQTNYLASNATSNFPGLGFTTTSQAGVVIVGTNDTAGLKLGVPAYLTTAMLSNAATISNIKVSAGAASNNLSALTFSDSNGISFGLNGSVLTATVATNYLTTAMQSQSSSVFAGTGFTTTTQAGAVVAGTHDTAGLKLGVPAYLTTAMLSNASSVFAGTGFTTTTQAGAVVAGTHDTAGLKLGVPAYLTTAMLSANSSLFAATGFTTTTIAGSLVAGTHDTAGLKLAVPAFLTVAAGGGITNINVSASNTSQNLSNIAFSNSNGISFGLNGSTITATVQTNYLTTAMQSQSSSVFAGTGFTTTTIAGSNVAGTHDTAGLKLAVPAFLTVAAGGGGAAISADGNSVSNGTVVFSNSNGVSFGMAGSTVTGSIAPGGGFTGSWYALGNTTQNSSSALDSYSLNGLGALTVGFSNGSIQLSAPASSSLVGALGLTASSAGSTISIQPMPMDTYANNSLIINTQTLQLVNGMHIVIPFYVDNYLSVSFMRNLFNAGFGSISFASTANTTYSYQQAETYGMAIYSQGTGASSRSLQYLTSTSAGLTYSVQVGRNATNNISVSNGITFPISNGTSTLSFSYAATNSTDQISSTHLTLHTGLRWFENPFAGSFSAGQYWMASSYSSAQTTQGTANLSAARFLHSIVGLSMLNITPNIFGQGIVQPAISGLGSFSTAGSGSTNSFGFSNITQVNSNLLPYFQMGMVT